MTIARSALLASLATLAAATAALAGPNSGGYFVLHAATDLQPSAGMNFCGQSRIRDCLEVRVSAPVVAEDTVVFLLAAFPFSNPRVAGVQVGLYFDSSIAISGSGNCGNTEIVGGDFPTSSGGGLGLQFNSPRTQRVNEIYWFATYAYGPGLMEVIDHPNLGRPAFADDTVPSVLDLAEGLGTLGFGMAGENPCLESYAHGACCHSNGTCTLEVERICEDANATYLGDGSECEPQTCWGACCEGEDCYERSEPDCAEIPGEFKGPGTTCGNTACVPTRLTWGRLKSVFED